MKKAFFKYVAAVALTTTMFTSCSKSNSTPSNTATVTCMVNGTKYSFTINAITGETLNGTVWHNLQASDVNENSISFAAGSGSLTTTSYKGGGEANFAGTNYEAGVEATTTTTVTVTSIHNGEADGTFTATMLDYNTRTKTINVTDGVFKNVPVQQ